MNASDTNISPPVTTYVENVRIAVYISCFSCLAILPIPTIEVSHVDSPTFIISPLTHITSQEQNGSLVHANSYHGLAGILHVESHTTLGLSESSLTLSMFAAIFLYPTQLLGGRRWDSQRAVSFLRIMKPNEASSLMQ